MIFPKTDIDVFPVAFGSARLGQKNTEAEAMELLDLYAAAGGNLIDTARVYAPRHGAENLSERIIGNWLHRRKKRDMHILAKGGHFALDTKAPRLDAAVLRGDVEGSLKTLRCEQIDIFCLHRDDPTRDVTDIIDTLQGFVSEGLIRHYGCSNWTPVRIEAANIYAQSIGATGFITDQNFLCLGAANTRSGGDPTCTTMSAPHSKVYEKWNMSLSAYTSLATGYFHKLAAGRDVSDSKFDTVQNRKLGAVIVAQANARGLSTSQILIGFLLSLDLPVIPVVEPRTKEQLIDIIDATSTRLPAQTMLALKQAAHLEYL